MRKRHPNAPRLSTNSARLLPGLLIFGWTAVNLISTPTFADAEVHALSSKAAAHESFDRDVDRAALSAQDSSIAKLSSLLKKYQGTRQEPILLSKLADLQQQKAGLLFRIAHGNANRHGKTTALDLSTYHKGLNTSIGTINLLIAKYPNYEDIPHAYFLRGKAYEELEKVAQAKSDYLHLIKNFPDVEETSPAYMSLADFAINANNHQEAIGYLKEIEKRPEDAHYPFALYKMAWSYFNLKDVTSALAYAEKQIAWYDANAPKKDSSSDPDNVLTSDNALKENTLLDVPGFYFEGLEGQPEKFPLKDALGYFKKIDHDGPAFGKMTLRFAKLLRSRNREADLDAVKDQFLASDSKRPESIDVILLTYEYQQNNRMYSKLVETTHDIIKLSKNGVKYEGMPRAQKMVLDTAEALQANIVKNKQTEEAHTLSVTLASLYDAFTQIVDDKDPRIPQVHYNLAETLFTIQDYVGATEHYRWVVEKGSTSNKIVAKTVADSSLKAISARYEVLRGKKLIATDIKAVSLPKTDSSPKMDPLITTWVEWIDDYADHLKKDSPRKEFDNFAFEANRTLYSQGDVTHSVERMEKFARKYPSSEYAIPSATLVLDTSIVGSDWKRTHELARSFMKVQEWKEGAFHKRLFEVAADSLYKQIEQKNRDKQYAHVLDDVDDFLKEYTGSARIPDALNLGGVAALANGEKKRAIDYFTKLIAMDKDPTRVSDALLARAQLEEEQYLFKPAADDYRAFLEMPHAKKLKDNEAGDFRRKILALTYLASNSADLKKLLAAKSICTDELEADCEKYTALNAVLAANGQPLDEDATTKAFERSRKSSGEARTLWAAYVLLGAKNLAFRDRNLSLRTLGSGWKDLDPMAKFALMPMMTDLVPKVFQMNRVSMKDVAPLRPDERYITRRVEVIREMENAATKILELPWSRMRAEVLNETASLYLDLAKGLAALPPPKGLADQDLTVYNETIRKLTVPFEEKGQDIRSKSFEIASRFGIEDSAFQAISEPFFTENPSQAKKLKNETEALKPLAKAADTSFVPLTLAYLPYIEKAKKEADRKHENTQEEKNRKAQGETWYTAWTDATREKHWAQVAFFLQEAREKKIFDTNVLGLIRAVSLAQAGARGEGLAELDDVRKDLDEKTRAIATMTLAQHYAQNFSRARAQDLYAELAPPSPASKDPKATEIAKDKSADSNRSPASAAPVTSKKKQ